MSQVNLQDLHKIKQSRKDAVAGYIREDKLLKDQEIPEAIVLICTLFYGAGCDEFDPKWKGQFMTLSDDNKRVEYKYRSDLNIESNQSIFCKKIIDSGYHEWKFKIVENTDSSCHFIIGLWRCADNVDPPVDTFFTDGKYQGYGWFLDRKAKTESHDGNYGAKFGVDVKEGDVIEMSVDFDRLSLCWKVNEISIGKSHDITQDKYRAAIFISYYKRVVEIIE